MRTGGWAVSKNKLCTAKTAEKKKNRTRGTTEKKNRTSVVYDPVNQVLCLTSKKILAQAIAN